MNFVLKNVKAEQMFGRRRDVCCGMVVLLIFRLNGFPLIFKGFYRVGFKIEAL